MCSFSCERIFLGGYEPPGRLCSTAAAHIAFHERILQSTMAVSGAGRRLAAVATFLASSRQSAHAFTAIQPRSIGIVRPRTTSLRPINALSLPISYSVSLPSPSNPLISAGDDMGNAAAVLTCATIAQFLGKSTSIGRLLGPPVTAMALTFLLASIGIMPPGGSAGATALQGITLSLATPLLLLGADIKLARKSCGPLLVSFVLASLATVLACTAALTIGPTKSMLTSALGADGIKVAAALMAKNIGGGINYFAVAAALGMGPNAVAAGICVDNIFALLYFPATSALGSGRPDVTIGFDDEEKMEKGADEFTVEKVSILLSLATFVAWIGRLIGGKPNALPVSTLLTVLGTTIMSTLIEPLRPAGEILGTVLLYIFFATAGAGGLSIADSVRAAFIPIGCFLTILYSVHGAILAGIRRLVLWNRRRSRSNDDRGTDEGFVAPQRLLVASSAAIGGPATAAALAKASGWRSLVTPSLLVGNLGYAIATFAAIAFHSLMV